jgi:chromosomal replication initiator protein
MNGAAPIEPRNGAQGLWETALSQLQLQVTRPNFDTWLKDTVGMQFADGLFVVGAPNDFATAWLTTKLRPLVAKTLSGIVGEPVDVVFRLANGGPNGGTTTQPLFTPEAVPAPSPVRPMPQPRLNPRYTFERFVVGPENRLAHAASLAVSEKPGAVYNPLFIYGATGLGKTHLLHAIGHSAWASHHRVLYATSEQFTNEFVESIRQARTEEFRAKYRYLDILLIDDVQFLAGKERTQEEFFYTLNDLHSASSQIVISSDRSPRLISLLEDRLRSRFEWGLIADIQPPVLETRLAILRAKSLEQRIDLPSDVLHFLAERSKHNIRELEGSFNRIVAHARLLRADITLDIAIQALAPVTPRERTYPSPDIVIKAVAEYFNLSPEDLCGKSRVREIADARHIGMYLLRDDAHQRTTDIGRLLGGRDHATVIHGLRKIESALANDTQLARQIAEIRALLSS